MVKLGDLLPGKLIRSVYSLQNDQIIGKAIVITLDRIDLRIIEILKLDARVPMLELAERVGLSATPCTRRIRRLEEAGVITGYSAQIDPASLGLTVSVLCSVRLVRHATDGVDQFLSAVSKRPEITECLLVAGNVDYVLRIWVENLDALGSFIRDVLQSIPSVAETTTMVILKDDKMRS